MKRVAVLALPLAVALMGGVWLMLAPDRNDADRVTPLVAPAADNAGALHPPAHTEDLVLAAADGLHTEGGLRGATWDGEVHLDANGRVVPDLGLRRLFDHALGRTGEVSNNALRDGLARQLRQHLPADAAAEALGLFDRYVAYLRAVHEDGRTAVSDAAERLAALVELRRQWLGPRMADGFFSEDETLARHGLERRAVLADAALTATERERRLDALDAALPPPWAESRRVATAAARAQALDETLGDADAATRHRERATQFGEAAAQRLALLDAQRLDWDRRVAAYVSERQRLGLDPAQADGAQQAAFQQLRSAHFDAAGQRRVASLEAIGALPPGG